MVRFTLFGVPVEIQPWFWLGAAMLSGAFSGNPTREEFLLSLLFIIAATISILVHEFGHALVGRRLGGGRANIVLWALGGLAYNEGGRFTRSGRFWMIAAGPGAGFALFALVFLILAVAFGPQDAMVFTAFELFHVRSQGISPRMMDFLTNNFPFMKLTGDFLWINFWWGILNLLPVLPLDGGRITELYVKPQKRVYQIAVVTAAAMVAFALFRGSLYMAFFFGFLAYQNYKEIDTYR
ncbi:site-2 protease family protein [Luteolibacter sp. GHJ8]|uniref:Site-2 protease family protein n=1 Tax=Luteolibacter rhizosphaerae TaxID=2989719 RepID=A0ABT3FXP3_9BACT|nr:site-2 protease family protein [Luteolibacter rhizosphaerae]MCW1912333.1 site-2 protease family protein [Luteolibacter rhizosphaerae]